MTKSAALLSSVALLSLVAASGGCGSSGASSAPGGDNTGANFTVGPNGTGANASTGAAGMGAGSTEINPSGATGAQGVGGDNGSSSGGSTEQSGSGTGAMGTGANGSSGNGSGATSAGGVQSYGGSITIDVFGGQPTSGGQGTTIDVTGGQGTSIDVTGGQGTSIDVTGGQGTSIDITGGEGTSIDVTGGKGTTIDLTGGRGTTIDQFGGTGNTTDVTGGVGVPPPPPKDAGSPGCVPTWFAKQINVLVLHNANVSNADTRGAMWVGGNLTGVGYDVGGDLSANCNRYDLAVGGNLTLSGWLVMHNGAGIYGGTLSTAGVQGSTCGLYPAASAPMPMPDWTQIGQDVKDNTAYFAGLPATGTVNGTTLNLGSSTCKIVVYNTSLCSFAGVTINVPANGTAIVNSTCTNPTFTNGQTNIVVGGVAQPQCNGQQGTGGACNRVLYNFPLATTVTVSGMSAQGAILAPYAKFLGNGGNVAGEVVVDSMDTGVEFHAWFFEGCLDTTSC